MAFGSILVEGETCTQVTEWQVLVQPNAFQMIEEKEKEKKNVAFNARPGQTRPRHDISLSTHSMSFAIELLIRRTGTSFLCSTIFRE